MYLKILSSIFVINILIVSCLFGGAVVTDFRGEAGFNQVELKWIVNAEANLKNYQILRSMDGVSYQSIATVKAKSNEPGEKTYSYIDRTVFKPNNNVFHYKLRFINTDNSTSDFERIVTVSPQISGARHTWGSIKAMFR
jgi:hypothetical protein